MAEGGREPDHVDGVGGAGGVSPGWHRPKTQLFRSLSLLWSFPTAGSCLILALNWAVWSGAPSVWGALAATRLEQWVALGLLLTHVVILFLARRFGRIEQPVALAPEVEDQDR